MNNVLLSEQPLKFIIRLRCLVERLFTALQGEKTHTHVCAAYKFKKNHPPHPLSGSGSTPAYNIMVFNVRANESRKHKSNCQYSMNSNARSFLYYKCRFKFNLYLLSNK